MPTLNLIPTAVLEVGRWWALVKDQRGDLIWEQQTDGCDAYIEAIGHAQAAIEAIEHRRREQSEGTDTNAISTLERGCGSAEI